MPGTGELNQHQLTEADTCRLFVTPKLVEAGWDQPPHGIAEQRTFTDGRIYIVGREARRKEQKRADYLLRYTRDFTLAVVEAKPEGEIVGTGMQQAKEYAEMLGLKFAYATNGHTILEFDFLTGIEQEISAYPTPQELWARLRTGSSLADEQAAKTFLTPLNHTTGKSPRYYQEIAINRVLMAILSGQKRVLLTMAILQCACWKERQFLILQWGGASWRAVGALRRLRHA